jgi:hypothetical protein
LTLHGLGARFSVGARNFFLLHKVQTALQPTTLLFSGYRRFFLGVKLWGHDVNHCPPSAEFKNEWSFISSPSYAFMAWTGRTFNFYVMGVNGKLSAFAVVPPGKEAPVRTELEAGWAPESP